MVKHFENVTAKIYAAMDRARREVELMEEYRTRLIADVGHREDRCHKDSSPDGGAWTESRIPANQAKVETACE